MLTETELNTWADRSEFWKSEAEKQPRKRLKRERQKSPLILCGHGVSFKIQNGALVIQDGISHAAATSNRYRFYPGELDIPQRIVLVECSGALTLAALRWLGEQSVTLIDADWQGRVVSVIAGSGVSIDPEKYRWQIAARADERLRLKFSTGIVRQKLEASIETLEAVFENCPARKIAVDGANRGIEQIDRGKVKDTQALLGVEGAAAAKYFGAWEGLELGWKGVKQYPVPKPWLSYSQRSSVLTGHKAKNWKADHPINAMLNYGYALLESRTRLKTVSEGFDPMAGIYHELSEGTPSYVLDVIEPDRPRVDRAILEFALSNTFSVKDFYLRKDGVCRLGPELARNLAMKLERNNISKSRTATIRL